VLYRSLMAENRSCSRTGCNRPAAASLSFRYETRQVWVTTLQARSGTRYDLCGEHADTLTVPKGWHRKEERPRGARRTPAPQVAPSAEAPDPVAAVAVAAAAGGAARAERAEMAGPGGPGAPEQAGRVERVRPDEPAGPDEQAGPVEPAGPVEQAGPEVPEAERVAPRAAPHLPADRYARLLSELPRLAAQSPPRTQPDPTAEDRTVSDPRPAGSDPRPARAGRRRARPAAGGEAMVTADAEVAAQLAIPVNDRATPDAVVVTMAELAGARRRSARETLRH